MCSAAPSAPPPQNPAPPAAVAPAAGPTVWGYQECMEIDSQFFWSGAPWDMVARQYVAQAMNQAFSMQKHSKEDVIAVSAYEGIGFSQVRASFPVVPWASFRVWGLHPEAAVHVHSHVQQHAACGSCRATVGRAPGQWRRMPMRPARPQAMQNYYLTTGRRIPFTIVRAMSDRTHKVTFGVQGQGLRTIRGPGLTAIRASSSWGGRTGQGPVLAAA